MLVGRLNPLLCCVKKLKDKTLNAHSDRAAKALAANQLTDCKAVTSTWIYV